MDAGLLDWTSCHKGQKLVHSVCWICSLMLVSASSIKFVEIKLYASKPHNLAVLSMFPSPKWENCTCYTWTMVSEWVWHLYHPRAIIYFQGWSLRKCIFYLSVVQSHTHCKAMVQCACTTVGLISLDKYLGECVAVLALQCCLVSTCTPGTIKSYKKPAGVHRNCIPCWLLSYAYALWYNITCTHKIQGLLGTTCNANQKPVCNPAVP